MKYYSFNEQWHVDEAHAKVTISENGIIDYYYGTWYGKMAFAGKSHLATPDNCIEDFVVVNWAWETDCYGDKI